LVAISGRRDCTPTPAWQGANHPLGQDVQDKQVRSSLARELGEAVDFHEILVSEYFAVPPTVPVKTCAAGLAGPPCHAPPAHLKQPEACLGRRDRARLGRVRRVPAGCLDPGDTPGGHLVSGIRPLVGVTRSFDILTEDRGYRIHGVPVNSMIREMEGASAPARNPGRFPAIPAWHGNPRKST